MLPNDFSSFFKRYIGKGLIVGLILVILGGGLISFIFGRATSRIKNTNNFYRAIVNSEKTEKNTDSAKAAQLVLSLIKEQDVSWEKTLTKIEKLKEDHSKYLDQLLSKKGQIIALSKNEIEVSQLLQEVPSWNSFGRWGVIISLFVLSLCATINLVGEASSDISNDLEIFWRWPWKKIWTYPTLLFLSIGLIVIGVLLIVVEMIEKCIKFIKAIHKKLRNKGNAATNEQGDEYTETETRPKKEQAQIEKEQAQIEKEQAQIEKKQAALETIETIRNKYEQTRKEWSKIYLHRIETRAEELRDHIIKLKNHLSELGKQINTEQKSLAAFRQELKEVEEKEQKGDSETEEKYLQEFDRLFNLAQVAAVEITNNIVIYTNPLYISFNDKKYEIGIFKIFITLKEREVFVENIANTHPDGKHHPYAPERYFCWGGLGDSITRALQQDEYVIAVQYILQAMQSAEGDKPQKVTEWKEVKT